MDKKIRDALEALPEERRATVEAAVAEEHRRRRKNLGWALGIFSAVLVVMFLVFSLADQGSKGPADGISAIARVDRAPDGRCLVGEKRSHCFGLQLTVFPRDGRSYSAGLDVNVPDRWASRVQPGSFVKVVVDKRDPSKVFLDQDAFAQPAPAAPQASSSN